ncbi:MAG: hypothetical protein U0R51_10940 [Solirubrobacterales bacterium]
MGISVSEEIRASLVARRAEADRILADAERKAGELATLAGDADRALAAARIDRLRELQRQIKAQQRRIETAYSALTEAMAVNAVKLAEVAREADFSIPPWPEGIRRTVEIRLAETREVTFRIETGAAAANGSRRQVYDRTQRSEEAA